MNVHAFRQEQFGGPETMNWTTVNVPDPGPGEVMLRHTAVGLNMADVYRRSGLYPVKLPSGLGAEAVGVVEAVGDGVTLRPGARVGYFGAPFIDSYSEARLIPSDRLINIPDGVADQQAAALLLKGMTAQYLLRRAYRVGKNDTILIHAAAGGVGTIVCQWANALGATVIGLVSNDEKAQHAKQNGCHHPLVVDRNEPKFAEKVRALTDGAGVDVVYDSVGKVTWTESVASVRRLGTVVSFGSASGPLDPINLNALGNGSPSIVRASLASYTVTPEERAEGARDLFDAVRSGAIEVRINQTYNLSDAPQAQSDIENGNTTGQSILLP